MSAAPIPPPGLDPTEWMIDAKGRWTHKRMIKPVDLARDELVIEQCKRALAMASVMAQFRRASMGDVQAFAALSAEQYGVKLPAKGNLTLYSYDGKYKIIRATAERIVFDERLQAAKTLIDECIREWSQGSSVELIALVNDAFQVDKEGEVSTSRVLGLKRHAIEHEKWRQAMKAIDDSMHTAESKSYLRYYVRNDTSGEYEPIPLDFSKAGAR